MALSPNIPTSFVPHSASASTRSRFSADFSGAFGFLIYAIFGLVVLAALGVFFYGRYLASTQASKDAALAKAEAAIDPTTVDNFLKLSNRLKSSETLMSNHLAFSGFFDTLSRILPVTVRFTALDLSVDAKGNVSLSGSGVAQTFNALAAASSAFAADGRIKDAIFSNLMVNRKDNTVSFALNASLDPKIVAFAPSATSTMQTPAPVAPIAPSMPASTTSATSTP